MGHAVLSGSHHQHEGFSLGAMHQALLKLPNISPYYMIGRSQFWKWLCGTLDAPGFVPIWYVIFDMQPPSPSEIVPPSVISNIVSEARRIFCTAAATSALLSIIQVSMASTRDTWSPEKLIVIAELCAIASSLHACPCTASFTLSSKSSKSSTAKARSLGSSDSILIFLYAHIHRSMLSQSFQIFQERIIRAMRYVLKLILLWIADILDVEHLWWWEGPEVPQKWYRQDSM